MFSDDDRIVDDDADGEGDATASCCSAWLSAASREQCDDRRRNRERRNQPARMFRMKNITTIAANRLPKIGALRATDRA
jgi:hypothetical protein